MTKKVTIHQPNYLPWIGFFDKIKKTDVFIILDTVDFSKDSFTQRSKIRTPNGWMWLTIPIGRKFYRKPINEVSFPVDRKWLKDHWKAIKFNYGNAEYFEKYRDFFENIYNSEHDKLSIFNESIIKYLFKVFSIDVEIIRSSQLDIDKNLKKDDLILEILCKVGANLYFSGKSGGKYLNEEKFKKENIIVKYHEFKHPIYKQVFPSFESNMAAIDALFNLGPEVKKLF